MPNCFQLISRTSGQAAKFNDVDDKLCAHFNVVPDAKKYHCGWYDYVGFALACGRSFEWLRQQSEAEILCEPDRQSRYFDANCHMLDIIMWLAENYSSDAWVER